MRAWAIGLGLLCVAGTAEASKIVIETTDVEDKMISMSLDKFNSDRKDPLTLEGYIEYLLTQWKDGLVTQGKAAMNDQYRQAAEGAPDSIKAQIQNLLTCGDVTCK